MPSRETTEQENIDRFYWAHGPCCAGCDWWESINVLAGKCTRRAPVRGRDRWGLIAICGCSLDSGPGHIVTPREHRCGDFKDDFDWSSLPPAYLRRIEMPGAPRRG